MIIKSSDGKLNFTFSDKEVGDLIGVLARAEHYWENINVGNDKCSTTKKSVHHLTMEIFRQMEKQVDATVIYKEKSCG